MKNCKKLISIILLTAILNTCSTSGSTRGTVSSATGLDISARAAVGRLEALGPLYTGDGDRV